jgi:hypothetical protein
MQSQHKNNLIFCLDYRLFIGQELTAKSATAATHKEEG